MIFKKDIWNAICLIVLLPGTILISDHNKAFSDITYIDRNQNDIIFIFSKSLWTDLGLYFVVFGTENDNMSYNRTFF